MKKRIQIDSSLLFLIILFTGFLYMNRHIYFISPGADNVLDFLGMIVILKGVLLRMGARGHKKAHSREGDRLVETGPYVLTRNPMYLGSFLIGVGFALVVWPWWSWPIFAAFFYMRFIVQILQEEKHLARLFPNDFTAYCQRAPRLLPSFSSALKARPRDIFKIDEAWSTKEKWGLLACAGSCLEWLQNLWSLARRNPVTILRCLYRGGRGLIMGLWVVIKIG